MLSQNARIPGWTSDSQRIIVVGWSKRIAAETRRLYLSTSRPPEGVAAVLLKPFGDMSEPKPVSPCISGLPRIEVPNFNFSARLFINSLNVDPALTHTHTDEKNRSPDVLVAEYGDGSNQTFNCSVGSFSMGCCWAWTLATVRVCDVQSARRGLRCWRSGVSSVGSLIRGCVDDSQHPSSGVVPCLSRPKEQQHFDQH